MARRRMRRVRRPGRAGRRRHRRGRRGGGIPAQNLYPFGVAGALP